MERTVDSHIKNLRRKIEPDPTRPTYIHSVFGVGYRFDVEEPVPGKSRAVMNTLWVRLTIAFTAATLVSIAVVALVANSQVSTDFRQFYMHSQVQQSGLIEQLGAYYGSSGSWKGVETQSCHRQGTGAGRGAGQGAWDRVWARV